MKTRSFPFDSIAQKVNELGFMVGDRDYGSADWSKYISYFLTNGIKNGGNNLKVGKNSETQVSVLEGIALINGRFFEMYEGPAYFDVPLNKISRIVVRLDLTASVRDIYLKLIEGTVDSVPNLIRNDEIYDLSLAQIITNESEIIQLIDERADNSLCGYINSLIRVDAKDILNSIEKELAEIENGSLVGLKNGTLQTGLNAEMIDGKTFDDITSIINQKAEIITGSVSSGQIVFLPKKPLAIILNSGAQRQGNLALHLNAIVTQSNPTYMFSDSSGDSGEILTLTDYGFKVKASDIHFGTSYGTGYRYIAFLSNEDVSSEVIEEFNRSIAPNILSGGTTSEQCATNLYGDWFIYGNSCYSSHYANYAFDNDDSTYWQPSSDSTSNYMYIKTPKPIQPKSFYLKTTRDFNLINGIIQGYNIKTNSYENLVENISGAAINKTMEVVTNNWYSEFKLLLGSDTVRISEFKIASGLIKLREGV